jgi:hypothetical protein
VEALLRPSPLPDSSPGNVASSSEADAQRSGGGDEPPFDEVKLVLALAWQRGRWDGSDGGRGGYGDVLSAMADARRYEIEGTNESRAATLVQDMRSRFHKLQPSKEDVEVMNSIDVGGEGCDLDAARRKCAGLVLKAMGFVDGGL